MLFRDLFLVYRAKRALCVESTTSFFVREFGEISEMIAAFFLPLYILRFDSINLLRYIKYDEALKGFNKTYSFYSQ